MFLDKKKIDEFCSGPSQHYFSEQDRLKQPCPLILDISVCMDLHKITLHGAVNCFIRLSCMQVKLSFKVKKKIYSFLHYMNTSFYLQYSNSVELKYNKENIRFLLPIDTCFRFVIKNYLNVYAL